MVRNPYYLTFFRTDYFFVFSDNCCRVFKFLHFTGSSMKFFLYLVFALSCFSVASEMLSPFSNCKKNAHNDCRLEKACIHNPTKRLRWSFYDLKVFYKNYMHVTSAFIRKILNNWPSYNDFLKKYSITSIFWKIFFGNSLASSEANKSAPH